VAEIMSFTRLRIRCSLIGLQRANQNQPQLFFAPTAFTGEKLQPFNFKPLSDGRGADYLSHRKNTVL
jgi:hypothetical protein